MRSKEEIDIARNKMMEHIISEENSKKIFIISNSFIKEIFDKFVNEESLIFKKEKLIKILEEEKRWLNCPELENKVSDIKSNNKLELSIKSLDTAKKILEKIDKEDISKEDLIKLSNENSSIEEIKRESPIFFFLELNFTEN